MVFLRKLKGYYILSHSIRIKDKVRQKTRYIGKVLPPKRELERIKKDFLRDIKKNRYKYLCGLDIEKIEDKKNKYLSEQSKLTKIEKEKKLSEFMIRFTYDSSKLSGLDITLRQTFLILKDGIVPKNFNDLKAIKQIENHDKGIVAITKYKGKLDFSFIKKLHNILFSGVDNSISGKLRSELRRNVRIAGTTYIPPKYNEIDKELNLFFKWYSSSNRKLHAIELASLIHLKIISLQPFVDGNSRLSRLLMNWVLWKRNYPLIDIPVSDLEEYYDVLDKFQIEKDERPFVKFIVKKFLDI